MEKLEPSYYVVLKAKVRYDKNLTPNAKLLYAEIKSLSHNLGFCYAKNGYFEKLYGVSKQSINSWLKQLEDQGYIERHIYREKGSKEILNRYITLIEKPTKINLNRPIEEILQDNTTAISLNSNNSKKKKERKESKSPLNPRRNAKS